MTEDRRKKTGVREDRRHKTGDRRQKTGDRRGRQKTESGVGVMVLLVFLS
jgi:hypothetical protein